VPARIADGNSQALEDNILNFQRTSCQPNCMVFLIYVLSRGGRKKEYIVVGGTTH